MEEQNLTSVEHKVLIEYKHWVSNAWYNRKEKKTQLWGCEINLVRSRITSKLIFASCVGYFDRAYDGFWGEPNMTAVELRRHTNTVYSLKVCVGQQRSSPGLMLVLLTSYMHHDDVCSLALRQKLGTTNNMFHTCIFGRGWSGEGDSVLLYQGKRAVHLILTPIGLPI